MDFLVVDSLRRMDPDYFDAWWERFEAEERILGEMGLPLPEPPWNAPGWLVEASGVDVEAAPGAPTMSSFV